MHELCEHYTIHPTISNCFGYLCTTNEYTHYFREEYHEDSTINLDNKKALCCEGMHVFGWVIAEGYNGEFCTMEVPKCGNFIG